jgi:hypothetical protein
VLSHKDILLNRSLSHWVSQENHLEFHIVSTLYTEENDTPITWAPSPLTVVHIVSSQTTHPSHGHSHPTQGHTHRYTHLMGILTPHRGTQRSISVSERNDTPITWAHPTHGLSHRPTHSVYVLEDVSRSCNHQHLGGCGATDGWVPVGVNGLRGGCSSACDGSSSKLVDPLSCSSSLSTLFVSTSI